MNQKAVVNNFIKENQIKAVCIPKKKFQQEKYSTVFNHRKQEVEKNDEQPVASLEILKANNDKQSSKQVITIITSMKKMINLINQGQCQLGCSVCNLTQSFYEIPINAQSLHPELEGKVEYLQIKRIAPTV